MPTTTLTISCHSCPPPSPLYLRWINRWGGWEYWMFQKRQSHQYNQRDVQTFEPYLADYSLATETTRLVSKSLSHTLTVGAQNLTTQQWSTLAGIIQSPCVQYYRKPEAEQPLTYAQSQAHWLGVVVDKSKVEMLTDEGRHSIELDLQLPSPQLAL